MRRWVIAVSALLVLSLAFVATPALASAPTREPFEATFFPEDGGPSAETCRVWRMNEDRGMLNALGCRGHGTIDGGLVGTMEFVQDLHLREVENFLADGVIVVKATISTSDGTFWFTAAIVVKDNMGTGHFFMGRGTGNYAGEHITGVLEAPLGGVPATLTGTWFKR